MAAARTKAGRAGPVRARHDDPDTWVPLARALAARLAGRLRLAARDPRRDDLAQEALLGLLDAAGRFDPARGLRFTTLAVPRARGQMLDWWRDAGGLTPARCVRRGAGVKTRAAAFGTWREDAPRRDPADRRAGPHAAVDDADEVEAALRRAGDGRARDWLGQCLAGRTRVAVAAAAGVSDSLVNAVVRRAVADVRRGRPGRAA